MRPIKGELKAIKSAIGGYYIELDGEQIASMPTRGKDNTKLATELVKRWNRYNKPKEKK